MAATRIAACARARPRARARRAAGAARSARRSAASRRARRAGRRRRGRRAGSRPSRAASARPGSSRSARSAARYVHGETRSKKNVTRGGGGGAGRRRPASAGAAAAARLARRSIREMSVAHRALQRSRRRIWRCPDCDRVRDQVRPRTGKCCLDPPVDSSNVRSGERRQPFPLAQIGGSPSPPYLPRSAIPTTSGRPTPAPSISSATSGPCSSCAISPAAHAASSSSSACCRASRPSSCARG